LVLAAKIAKIMMNIFLKMKSKMNETRINTAIFTNKLV